MGSYQPEIPDQVTPTPDVAAAYVSAYRTMALAENADITTENSSSGPTQSAAINDRIKLRRAFDTTVHAISFPANLSSDVTSLLNADATLEAALGSLSVNVDNISNYNSVFTSAVLPAENGFKAADSALSRDLGVETTTSPTPT